MLTYILIFSLSISGIFFILAIKPDINRFIWARKYLTIPYKNFKIKKPVCFPADSNMRYHLSQESDLFLQHYMEYEKTSLENLIFDINIKLQKCKDSKHLSYYLTTGFIPLFSLVITSFALLSNKIPEEKLIFVLGFTIIIVSIIILFVLVELFSQMFIQETMINHLLVLEKALRMKIDSDENPSKFERNRRIQRRKR